MANIVCDDLQSNPVADIPSKKLEERVNAEFVRHEAPDNDYTLNNDEARIRVGGQVVLNIQGAQSEKNMRNAGGGDETRPLPDYSEPAYPNATLPTGWYDAERLAETPKYDKPSAITSMDAQLPDFPKKGVERGWGFLVHSFSQKAKTFLSGFSLGCQVIPDADFDRYNDTLDALGVSVGKHYRVQIRDYVAPPRVRQRHGGGGVGF